MYQLISKKMPCMPLSWAKTLMVIAMLGGFAEVFWVCVPHIYVTQSVNIHFFLMILMMKPMICAWKPLFLLRLQMSLYFLRIGKSLMMLPYKTEILPNATCSTSKKQSLKCVCVSHIYVTQSVCPREWVQPRSLI